MNDTAILGMLAVVSSALRSHVKRRPITHGCLVTAWVCACGKETLDFDGHVAREVTAAVLAHTDAEDIDEA